MRPWQRYLHHNPRIVDAAIVLALMSVSLPRSLLGVSGVSPPRRWPRWPLAGLAGAAFMWRRGPPRLTALVSVGCTVALTALGYVLTPLLLAPAMAALFALAVRASPRTAYTFTVAAIVIVAATALIAGPAGADFDLKVTGPRFW